MIILNAYNVSADGKWLTIDTVANPSFVPEGVYLSSLRVSCTGDFGPSDTSATTFDTLIGEAINEYTGEVIDWEDCPTEIRIKLDVDTLNKPFYLLVVAADPEHAATTCANKNTLTAITFNKYPLYQHIACAAKEFEGCEPPVHFINYLMQLKALEASIAVGDANAINYYFDWLILHGGTGVNCGQAPANIHPLNSGCGCH